jgi:ATP-binding cassette subfamily B protein
MHHSPLYSFRSTYQILRLIWQSHPIACISTFLLTVAQGLLPLAHAWITKVLLDWVAERILENTAVFHHSLVALLGIQTGLMIASAMLPNLSQYLNSELQRRLTLRIESAIYHKVNSLPGIAHFENPQVYDTIRLAQQGAEQSASQTLTIITELIQSLVTLLSFIGVLFSFNAGLAGLVLFAALPQLGVQMKLGQQRVGLGLELSPVERRKVYYGFLLTSAEAAKEVRLFGLGSYLLQKLLYLHQHVHHAERRQQKRELRWELVLSFISTAMGTVAFIAVVLAAFAGRLSVGDITLYVSAVSAVQEAVGQLMGGLAGLMECVLFYSHYQTLLSLSPALPIAPTLKPVSSLSRGLELRHVWFRYGDRHPWILQDVNLKIPAGACLALVGLNGAGKSTLVKLITRLYDPTKGQILWNGIDIREFDPNEFRNHISTIFQDFMRYDLTAYDNIGFGNLAKLHDYDWIQQAAHQANIHQDIQKLPQGYETELSRMFAEEGQGIDLSGGQWQRIATARMFARNAELLILDEPSSALDAQAEYEAYCHFSKLMAGRTSIIISHRFSTVQMADIVAVLDQGRVVEQGSHDALLAAQGIYARLYAMQAEGYLKNSAELVV